MESYFNDNIEQTMSTIPILTLIFVVNLYFEITSDCQCTIKMYQLQSQTSIKSMVNYPNQTQLRTIIVIKS